MPSIREIAVLSGARSAIGDNGGALEDQASIDFATKVIAEVVRRAGVAPESVVGRVLPQFLNAGNT
jgi:acetyl-CoA C-acetyltransferase